MSDELTQLQARVAGLEENNRLLKLEADRLQTLAGGAMTELSRREADTKPLVDGDLPLIDSAIRNLPYWAAEEKAALARIRKALQPQEKK